MSLLAALGLIVALVVVMAVLLIGALFAWGYRQDRARLAAMAMEAGHKAARDNASRVGQRP